ncbi:ABC transporter permease [Rhizobium sp. KVB221]|uniref:ABC transporter permease n=1 Tax=Rhizobium setariae TaxID=2801340 RepID=A0A937CQB3_9HYPH|nr:ABC transporter permease [Rhizobium setariae]MBL0374229.1 ABC transporter permease [Rhizobium setariae]
MQNAPTLTMPAWLSTFHQAIRYNRTRIGIAVTALVILFAIIGPFVTPYEPSAFVGRPFMKPSADFLLGTDFRGRDVLSRLLYGGLPVVWMSFASAAIGMILGATFGLIAAYSKGWIDQMLMRIMDVFLSIPLIIFVLLFVSLIGTQQWLIVLLVGVAHMPQVARITRGVASDIVGREFVEFAEALSVPRWRILFREILPNITTPLLVEFGIRIVWSISGIAALSVMGYGIQPPDADWGLMINENRGRIASRPLAVLSPALCIALFAFGINMIAEGIAGTMSGSNRKSGGEA